MANNYQPVTATPQRTFFRFAPKGQDGVVALRYTVPRSEFEGNVGLHPLACQIVAEQLIFAALAGHAGSELPDCVDMPLSANSKVVLLEPTALSPAQVAESLSAVRETLASMRAAWPAAYRLAEAWIGSAPAKNNTPLLRAALEPLGALGASQSETALVPPGSAGFARFLPERVTFHGTPPPRAARRYASIQEAVIASLTGEPPESWREGPSQGAESFEFPEPCAATHPPINTNTDPNNATSPSR